MSTSSSVVPVVESRLSAALRAAVNADAWTWIEEARALAAGPLDALLDAYARAPRHVGRETLALTDEDRQQLHQAAPNVGFEHWTHDDAARCLLLCARLRHGRSGGLFVGDAVACYENGDAREQQSWLRALALWPEAAAFLPQAVDACRTNIVPVFEALACDNPYPAAHFPERNFNQMILKALFNSIALSRVVGLAPRLNPELSRMARDYAAERTAAGRTVPPDIGLAIHDTAKESQ